MGYIAGHVCLRVKQELANNLKELMSYCKSQTFPTPTPRRATFSILLMSHTRRRVDRSSSRRIRRGSVQPVHPPPSSQLSWSWNDKLSM